MKTINVLLAILILLLWGCVFFIHGILGAASWIIIKLILPPVGVLGILIGVIRLIKNRNKNRKSEKVFISLMVVFVLPILLLFNVIELVYPVTSDQLSPSITIESPFKENVIIGWGGDSISDNAPHVTWPSERFAYDIVKAPYDMKSPINEDYGIYDMAIYAPIEGTVIAVKDNEDDIIPNTEEFLSMEGNYVYIKIESTGTYLLMNHLKKNTIVVQVGDHVKVGDYLGNVGNSGSTSEPHLHIHHQRQDPQKTIHPILAEGLPLYFYDEYHNSYTGSRYETLIFQNKKDQ
ncbi:MAG: M23 family metallopeptidase [Clostridiales bacterium]|nr:M23 family metallopeptidase [Clostridiales bacterium]